MELLKDNLILYGGRLAKKSPQMKGLISFIYAADKGVSALPSDAQGKLAKSF